MAGLRNAPAEHVIVDSQPIPSAVADQAAEWLTVLMSDELEASDHLRWQQWRDAHPDHARAWQHIEKITGRLRLLHGDAAYRSLSAYSGTQTEPAGTQPGRRKALRRIVAGCGVAATGWLVAQDKTWQTYGADYRTATGQQQLVSLDDGTQIMLNTATAIKLHFNSGQRRLSLLAGEVLIVTGHAKAGLPQFLVETAQGSILALGTRFIVRQMDQTTRVAVIDSKVAVKPHNGKPRTQILQAGEQLEFSAHEWSEPTALDAAASAWTRGQILADNMLLGDFIAELARYRSGFIHCAPAIAQLRLSGVFPVPDTEKILATLPHVLPVKIRLHTRYWVSVEDAR
jgi:transmembrane sensor